MQHTLTADTPLVRLNELEIHLAGRSDLIVRSASGEVRCRLEGLAVLDVFSQPTPLRDALGLLSQRGGGRQAMHDLAHTIQQLYEAGILCELDIANSAPATRLGRYDSPEFHISMLDDRTRTQAFLDAIGQVVRPGDVVLDLGTGTGVLALAAARAGASHVYAVEAGYIGQSARALFEANGFGDRITLISGWSTAIELPERADVLVSEILGRRPLSERILPTTLDARHRLLKEDARILPQKVRTWGLPVHVPGPFFERRCYTPGVLSRYQEWYGLNFTPLQDFSSNFIQVETQQSRYWDPVGCALPLGEIDLASFENLQVSQELPFSVSDASLFNGFLLYFELQIAEGICLTTCPTQAGSDCHWHNPVWLLPQTFETADLTVTYGTALAEGGWVEILSRSRPH